VDAEFELFDHTADIGIRVRAPTLENLVHAAGQGLYAVIGELVPNGDPQPRNWDLSGEEPAILLRDYLTELLMLFERDRRMMASPQVGEFTLDRLAVHGPALLVDEARSVYQREVKAVTYHELKVVRIPAGFQATIIVDV
jgi:SHS2 domain-containing protein